MQRGRKRKDSLFLVNKKDREVKDWLSLQFYNACDNILQVKGVFIHEKTGRSDLVNNKL